MHPHQPQPMFQFCSEIVVNSYKPANPTRHAQFNSINSKKLLQCKEKREFIFDRSSTFKNSSKIALSVKIDTVTASIGVVEPLLWAPAVTSL